MPTPTPLKRAIFESGLTQRKIAEDAGLSESRLSLIANGHWNPDEPTRAAIARALGRQSADLFEIDQVEAA